jgi:2-succinyl-5-enolpyruvyl-6-hydroxy-3-cyclohexene-1-carboxylate synthase
VSRLLSRTDIEIVAVPAATGWTDPGHQVARVVGRPAVADADDPGWLDLWRDRDASVSAELDELLEKQGELTPHQVAAGVSAALPPLGLLYVGSSNPVRDLDLMAPRHTVGERRLTIANRGLSGIDGTVSSAVGAALGRERTSRAFALVGDVTFLHDSNGLVLGPGEVRPDLTIVVVNDDGGSIFASLEQGAPSYAASFDKLFGTPHGVGIAALCAATGTPHRRVTTVDELETALTSPPGGIEVIEAGVRRDNRRELDAAIRALVPGG